MSLSSAHIVLLATAIILVGCSSSSSTPSTSDDATLNDNSGTQIEGIGDGENSDTTTSPDNVSVESALLNPGNANAVILQAFDVLSGRAYDQRLVAFPYTKPVEIDSILRYLSAECQNTGAVTQAQARTETNDGRRFTNDSFFVDCQIGGDVLNGRVVFDEDFNCCDYSREFSDSFAVSFEPGGVMELAGSYLYDPSISYKRTVGVTDFNYHFTYSGGSLTVSNANTLRTFRLDGRGDENDRHSYMTGTFSMVTPVLEGSSIDVSVTEAFINTQTPSQLAYESGRMEIVASNSTIVLDANTGDQNTVEVTISSNAGVTVTVENWSTWRAALSFVPAGLKGNEQQVVPDGNGTAISESNYKDVLSGVFSVFTGEQFGSAILALPDYPTPDFPAGFLTSSAPDGFGDPTLQACSNGGSATLTPYKFGARQITSGWDFNFTNCEYNGERYEGLFITRDYGNYSYSSSGFSINEPTTSTSFSGLLDYKHSSNRDGGPSRFYSLSSVDYFSDDGDASGRGSLRAASFTYSSIVPYSAGLSGSFSFSSIDTQGVLVNVTTADPLVSVLQGNPGNDNPEIAYFRSGLLVVDAGNNNTLELNPSSGDPLTFEVSVFQPNREPFTVIENWRDWRERVAFKYDLKPR